MFPHGKQFAFTIFDDTDDATTDNVEPIYRLLRDLGMRTTKTAWPMDCPEGSKKFWAADTLQDENYRAFTQRLISEGFELASHGATMESSLRSRTEDGLAFMRERMGLVPTVHANHGQNRENVYWGCDRYQSLLVRLAARMAKLLRKGISYEGHVETSPYFWGDLCRTHFKYVRNFAFGTLNLAEIPPARPYRVGSTPFVNYWFTTSDAPDVHHFNRLITRRSVDQLVSNGGYTIVSTHLGKGFVKDGEVNATVQESLRYIASQDGWFVPVSELLDHLMIRANSTGISKAMLFRLEMRHFFDRFANRLRG